MMLFCLFLAHSAPVVHLSVAHVAQHLDIFHLLAAESHVRDVMDIEFVAIVLSTATLLTCSTAALERLRADVLPALTPHVLATIVAPCFIDLLAGRSDGLEKPVCAGPRLRHDRRYDFVCVQ